MSSQNVFLDQRMKGKESFPYTVPWREGLARWAKVGLLSACAVGSVLPAIGLAATIQGVKFNDLNGNGVKDVNESGLANHTIFVGGTTTEQVKTDSNGNFSYQNSTGGSFSLWTSLPPAGWSQTIPKERTYTVQVTQNQTVTGINFGIRDTSIPLPAANSLPQVTSLIVNGSVVGDSMVVVDERTTLTLKGNFTDADSSDTHTFEWNFGDGSTVNTQEATHSYSYSSAVSLYNAIFTVKDSQGGVGTKTVPVKVIPNTPPTVNLSGSTTARINETANLVANVTDPNLIDTHSFLWEFKDDGSTANTRNVSHTYKKVGEYEVKLTVTDSRGGIGTNTMKVTVIPNLQVIQPESLGSPLMVDGVPVNQHQTTTSSTDYYLSSTGEQIAFQRLANYVFAMSKPGTSSVQLFNESALSAEPSNNPFGRGTVYKFSDGQATTQAMVQFSSQTSQTSGTIEYVSPLLTTGKGDLLAVTNNIVVAKSNNPTCYSGRVLGEQYHQAFLQEMSRLGLSLVRQLDLSKDNYLFTVVSPYSDVSKVFEIVRSLRGNCYVQWSEPDFLVTPLLFQTPNDPQFPNQWHLNNTGQNGGKVNADIDAPEGWDIKKGEGIIIAIHDDGVDINHPDLAPAIAQNGWDFADNDNNPSPLGSNNHGTAVAGVAAARGNNGIGVAGSAMQAQILPIRTGSMSCAKWADSIRYEAKYAHVANHSWGISTCQTDIDAAIKDAVTGNINGAIRGALGVPMVFASGNSASGWMKFGLRGFSVGTYSFRWKFSKNGSNSSGYDTVWLDDITLPGGQVINFENATVNSVPSGFTSVGPQQWKVVSDGIHARGATGKSVKAGTITHNQETYLQLTNVSVGAGDFTFWAWVSSEQNADFFTAEISINGGTTWLPAPDKIQYTPGQYGHQNEVGYPASNPYAIAVGASSDGWSGQEERSAYSQFGPKLDVVAPSNSQGQGITTTDRVGSAGYSSTDYTNTFGGTSSAAPLTTGVIAVLLSNNPTLKAEEVRNCLRAGADKIGEYVYPDQSSSAISLGIGDTGGRNDFYGYGRVNLERTLKACMPSPDPCASPTIKSNTASGNWNTAGTWTRVSASTTGNSPSTPDGGDTVLIQGSHKVIANLPSLNIKGLCVLENGVLEGLPHVNVVASPADQKGTIRNYGIIRGKNGNNATSSSLDGENGGNVSLTANYFTNGSTGRVYAGRGGDDITYLYFSSTNASAKGGDGGNINIYADYEAINHGKIGPSPMHKESRTNSYQGCSNTTPTLYYYVPNDPNDAISGGNGGTGSNWSGGTQHNSGSERGGKGGATSITAFSITNSSTGRISSGYGGDAMSYDCSISPVAGIGGDATLTPMGGDIYGLGEIDGGGGNIWIEPRIIMSDSNLHIYNAENITIFGGDDTTLSLNNLSNQAIVANNKITLAVGKNGVVDLTGSANDALKAGTKVEILADKVLLADDMELGDVSNAPDVAAEAPKIVHHVTVSGIGAQGDPNTTVSVGIRVVNSGPTTDTYTLTVTDSAGWQLGTLPAMVTVEGLKSTELQLDVTLPAKAGATDTITVIATSHGDSTVSAKTEIDVSVESPVGYDVSGKLLDNAGKPLAGVTVKTGDKTTTTDANGAFEISELLDGDYTMVATKDGYTITSQDFTVKGENVTINLAAVKVGPPQASGTITAKAGAAITGAKVEVVKMDNSQVTQTTTTDANGQWQVTGLPAGNYTATVTAPGYNSVVQQFEVSDTNSEAKVIISPPRPLLTLNMTSSTSLVRPGEKVTYTLTVTNKGTVPATGAALKLALPTGLTLDQLTGETCDASQLSCTLPNLTPGAKTTITLVVMTGSDGGKFDLTATLTSNDYPSDVSTATLELLPYLSVTPNCTPTKDVPMLGDWQCDWTVELSPDAPDTVAKDVQVTVTIPQGVTVSATTADVGTVTPQSAKVLWTLQDLSLTGVNRATLTMAMKLTDMFLLALTQEAKVTATNYPAQTARARTAIFIDDSIKVDLALVIDTTGSMQGEIDGVKAALKKFIATIDTSQSPTVALIVFKDVATVKAFTKDLNVLLKVIDTLKAEGGGTCPEASVEALTKAARHVKAGGQIWFTTDASPYPDAKVQEVLDLLKSQNIRLNATVTGDCGDVNSWNE